MGACPNIFSVLFDFENNYSEIVKKKKLSCFASIEKKQLNIHVYISFQGFMRGGRSHGANHLSYYLYMSDDRFGIPLATYVELISIYLTLTGCECESDV